MKVSDFHSRMAIRPPHARSVMGVNFTVQAGFLLIQACYLPFHAADKRTWPFRHEIKENIRELGGKN